ncbi:hypothetical protein DAKH74_050650 [Maudiozyma humilis]|uniref:ER to Golgi transport-related protein n=1 Tax=Maudiozyma humilis TaxID=51915 RepID=A0AAV5S4M5_MAUHU|nr:hypothetical protein DAKH74_050650 [Kazachstania humilis]
MSYRGPSDSFGAYPGASGASVPVQQPPQQAQGFQPTPFNTAPRGNVYGQRNAPPESLHHRMKKLLERLDRYTAPIEDLTTQPAMLAVRPFVPGIARFCIVVTFLEDSLRIFTQWNDQVFYLHSWKHYPRWFVVIFLATVSLAMLAGAVLILARRHIKYATIGLCGCIVSQALVYGLFSGTSFLLRNISVIGGLLIAYGSTIVQSKNTFAMLPELSDKSQRSRGMLLLVGRILIVLMFVAFTFGKSWFTVLLTVLCTTCFAVGYKTKLASIILVTILAFYNLYMNNYWFYDDSKRDFLRYEFFQNLSIIGGLLLVTNTGAGSMSIDEKKKVY